MGLRAVGIKGTARTCADNGVSAHGKKPGAPRGVRVFAKTERKTGTG